MQYYFRHLLETSSTFTSTITVFNHIDLFQSNSNFPGSYDFIAIALSFNFLNP